MSHVLNLSSLENQILKERLLALYDTMQNILFTRSESERSTHYLSLVISYTKKIQNLLKEKEENLIEINEEKEQLEKKIDSITRMNRNFNEEIEKSSLKNREKFQRSKDLINQLTEEKEKLKNSLEASEYQFKVLSDEHEKLRQRVKNVKIRQFENENEKICKNCKNLYTDEENFNWSCKVHPAQFSGEIWWCCGKKGENAQGCKICMHESKEEYEKIFKADDFKTNFCSVKFYLELQKTWAFEWELSQ